MTSLVETVYETLARQAAQLPQGPTVARNRVWANNLAELPFISVEAGADDIPADDFSAEASSLSIYHDVEFIFQLLVARENDRSLSLSIHALADALARRFHLQLDLMRKQAPGLVHVAEQGLSEIEYISDFDVEVARAAKTFLAKLKKPRGESWQ